MLRLEQVRRILGIEIDREKIRQILVRLGLHELSRDDSLIEVRPPSWRRDLEREIDLIEEVGRVHSYDHVPEDFAVPMTSSFRSDREQVDSSVRETLCADGFYETVTMSFVDQQMADCFSLWSNLPHLKVDHSSRRQENLLRTSLVPSLLAARRLNERRGVPEAELFELARVYLPNAESARSDERINVGVVSGRGLREMRGIVDAILAKLHVDVPLQLEPIESAEFEPGHGAKMTLDGQLAGYLGKVSPELAELSDLRNLCCVAELEMARLYDLADLIPIYRRVPNFPASHRELSLEIDETVPWSAVERLVRAKAGSHLESISFFDVYRGRQLAAGKKSIHFGFMFRAPDRTLTSEEVEESRTAIIKACEQELGAELRGS